MKIRHEYPDKSADEVAGLMKKNVEQLLGDYGHYVGKMDWVTERRVEGGGKGVKASIEAVGNTIEIEVKLPFLLRPLRAKAEAVIRRKLGSLA
jgi:hypothetical protein